MVIGAAPIWGLLINKYTNYIPVQGNGGVSIGIWNQGSDQFRQGYLWLLQEPKRDEHGEPVDPLELVWEDWQSDDG